MFVLNNIKVSDRDQRNIGEHTNWVQTSYNNNFRGTYAGTGSKYDPILDIFINNIQE